MSSHRQIFKSSAIIGGASGINVVIGIVKVKVLALLLGPAGVGLMGLYSNIMSLSATLAGCGVGNSGVRQLAASAEDADTLAIVRRALWVGNIMLGLMGFIVLYSLREVVALWVFNDAQYTVEIGWLGVGVFLTLIAGSQTALLQGLRRIGDLARVQVISALLGTVAGIPFIWWLGADGVLWFVLSVPAVSVLVASYYAGKLPRPKRTNDWLSVRLQWLAMLKLGIPFMAAGLLSLVTQLAVRSLVLQEIGLEASGYFQAAWAISMTYIGFVLTAMSADYYPRLTGVISEHAKARKLVAEQAEMALLLAAPVLLAMITLAPLVMHVLYAKDFTPAAEILRWQVLGDMLKVVTWPMGFILLAMGRGGLFIVTQLTWNIVYLVSVYAGIESVGLVITGIGFFFAYAILVFLNFSVASWLIGYRPAIKVLVLSFVMLVAGLLVIYLAGVSVTWGYISGTVVTLLITFYCLQQLNSLMDLRSWLRRKLKLS